MITIGRRHHLQRVPHNHHTTQIALHVFGVLLHLQNGVFGDVVVKSNGSWEQRAFILPVQRGDTVAMSIILATHCCTQNVKKMSHDVPQQLAASFVVCSHHEDVFVPRVGDPGNGNGSDGLMY